MDSEKEQKAWRGVKYRQKFLNAFRGMYVVWKTTRHLYIHIITALLVVVFGFYFKVSNLEWIALVFAIGFVFVSEVFNTAIEIDIDLTSPGFHPFARDTKDVAAATPDLTYENRLQVGMSNDGKNIFYSWADSDPANTATNVLPDIYVAGRNIDSVNVIGKTCLTLGTTFENAATMHCMAPQVRDFGGEFYPYIVLTQLGATADNDPCKYYFLKDAKIVVGIETNNIDKNIANVSNIYPNPTNGLSNIDLSLLKSSNVTIEVVNMMGQVVSSDNLGNKAAGMHKLTVNANGLTSGIYFVTVKAGNSTNTSKLILR